MILKVYDKSEYEWHRFYLSLAQKYSEKSKDPSTKVGAVAVDPKLNIPVMFGYNGFPRGVADTLERYNDRDLKYKMVVHAEQNCIAHAARKGVALDGCVLYVWPTLSKPNICPECAKMAINAGIKAVYSSFKENNELLDKHKEWGYHSGIMLKEAGINFWEIP